MPLDINFDQHYAQMRQAFGESITDPVPVRLGSEDEDGNQLLRVPDTDTDSPNMFYFSELPNMQEFRGWAVNAGPAAIQEQFLRFGTPVYIKRDVNTRLWLLHGLVPDLGSEFNMGVDTNIPSPVRLSQILNGLLDETDPPSMTARVYAGAYTVGDTFYYWETQGTSSMTSHVPATNGKARYRLAQLAPTTGVLSYINGAEFDAILTHQQVWALDGGAGTYLPQVTAGNFRCGYAKLISGMTAIRRVANLWQVHELLTKGSSTGALNGARVERSSDFNVNDNSDTVIDWNTETYDTNTYHDNGTNPSRLTVPTTGYYRVEWKFQLSSVTQWSADLLVDGTLNETLVPITTAGGYPQGFVTKALTSAQYVQLQVWQNSGGAEEVQTGSWFGIQFLGT